MIVKAEQGTVLLGWARARLREELGGPRAERPSGAWCEAPGATFVTLRWPDDGLHGCIGTLEPQRALVDDVAHNVVAAALFDPRAEPIALADAAALDIELSILSALEPIVFTTERSALAALRLGTDGVVFATRGHRATFLPSMWPRLPTPDLFMAALKRKAGFPAYGWSDDVRLWRYTVDKHVDVHGDLDREGSRTSARTA